MGERALTEMLWALNLAHEKKKKKLTASRPAVQIQALLKAEIIKQHVFMESLGNICVEKRLWEGNGPNNACVSVLMCARVHTHTHTRTHAP